MRVFISWSTPVSQKAALALREWLPDVIQQLQAWVSTEDIAKGRRWGIEIAQQLEGCSQGIVCVTPSNMREPWLNFEAGALAKSMDASQVRPLLIGLQPRELVGPLAEFQATVATNQEDMLRLVVSLNSACATPLPDERLRRAFARTWPDLASTLESLASEATQDAKAAGHGSQAVASPGPVGVARRDADVLGEVLERIRGIEREMTIRAWQGTTRGRSPLAEVLSRTAIDSDAVHRAIAAHLVGAPVPGKISIGTDKVTLDYGDEPLPEKAREVGTALSVLRPMGIERIDLRWIEGGEVRTATLPYDVPRLRGEQVRTE